MIMIQCATTYYYIKVGPICSINHHIFVDTYMQNTELAIWEIK